MPICKFAAPSNVSGHSKTSSHLEGVFVFKNLIRYIAAAALGFLTATKTLMLASSLGFMCNGAEIRRFLWQKTEELS